MSALKTTRQNYNSLCSREIGRAANIPKLWVEKHGLVVPATEFLAYRNPGDRSAISIL